MLKRMSMSLIVTLSLGVVFWQPPNSLAFNSPQTVMEKNKKDASKADGEKTDAEKTDAETAAVGLPGFPNPGGIARFTPNPIYDCAGSTYTYTVSLAPPDTWGTLSLNRNGSNDKEVTLNWAKTDANGFFSKSWTVSTDQTAKNIRIFWDDGSATKPLTKVDDITPPTIYIDMPMGTGAPGTFSGTASDKKWGSGFGSWTTVLVTYRNTTTNKYWNGSCYCSPTPPSPSLKANFVISSDGYSLTWSATPPPGGAHTPFNTYKWTVVTNDHCTESNKPSFTFTF